MSYPLNWDLQSLVPSPESPEFRKLLEQFKTDLTAAAERSDRLPAVGADPQTAATWGEFLAVYQNVEARAADLHAGIGCYAAADAANKLYQQLEGTLSALDPLRERMLTNIDFALQAAGKADFNAFVQSRPDLQQIAFFLQTRREHAALRLPKEQELLAADLAVDGLHAWGRLYDRLSGELRVSVMERGEIVKKSPGQIRLDVADRATRENNFCAADKAWAGIADSCADALNHISGTRLTLYRRVGVPDHLELPLRLNHMSRATLDAMWNAISARKEMLTKYLAAKADMLGLARPAWYDLQAPLPPGKVAVEAELSYDEASEEIIRAFTLFSPDFGDFARRSLTGGWVEAENRAGKRQGGFCTGFPTKKQSRIFMTFTNTPDSMSTLAHELGHAYHSHVLREQPLVLQDYPMNLAETASTFAEAVLAEERLKRSEPAAQLGLLEGMLSDSVAFLMNIHARFIFEDRFHRERAEGELSADRFSALMLDAQKEAYANALADDGWNPHFWISKLHFYISGLPFYNFPYTFGYLLSLGVYALAAELGSDFPRKYGELLIATGCQNTEDAVRSTFGYDLQGPEFWNKSLDIVEHRVNRFLELAR